MDLQICVGCGARSDVPVVEDGVKENAKVDQDSAVVRPNGMDGPSSEHGAAGRAVLVCTACGHRQPFRRLPLFALTGPSGAGKSTVARRLVDGLCAGDQCSDQCNGPASGPSNELSSAVAATLTGRVVILEQDVLWTAGLQDPAGGYRGFRATWLRMAGMIHQSGRPVLLCGTVVPVQFEECPQRVFVGDIHYLALVCDSGVLRERLRARPAWRGWDEARIQETLRFNEWLQRTAPAMTPSVDLLDTTTRPLHDTVRAVIAWVNRGLLHSTPSSPGPRQDR